MTALTIIIGGGLAYLGTLIAGWFLLASSKQAEERATEEQAAKRRGLYAVPDEEE